MSKKDFKAKGVGKCSKSNFGCRKEMDSTSYEKGEEEIGKQYEERSNNSHFMEQFHFEFFRSL